VSNAHAHTNKTCTGLTKPKNATQESKNQTQYNEHSYTELERSKCSY